MSRIRRAARYLAARNPALLMACPCCAATVIGAALDRHLDHVHPDDLDPADEMRWRAIGLGLTRLTVESGEFHLRQLAGLRHRRIAVVERVTVGPIVGWRPDPTLVSYTDDFDERGSDRRVGAYLRIDGGGEAITVHSRSAGQLRTVWTGWYEGKAVRRADLTLAAGDFVALQYLLHEIGPLRLRPDRAGQGS